ncbi:MAG: peptidase M22 [Clostridium sp.]|nr:peptidase M22 [Clostridium sp.]
MYLGFDTSNYTTSVAAFDGDTVVSKRKLLSVKSGERGLRQSDAVFQHTVNMPDLISEIDFKDKRIDGVAVSTRPRNIEGSYMPCFLVGINNAVAVSNTSGVPLYKTSHQVGHILAALYSINRLDLINEKFIAFHISGGTTEALLVEPDESEIIKASVVAESTDLKAGQAIDRTGVLLGLSFPCGKELDALSLTCCKEFKHKTSFNGLNCSLSGIENKAKKMVEDHIPAEETAKFVITYISDTLDKMTEKIIEEYGNLPLVFAGGVTSNTIIRNNLSKKYGAYFAKPEFSCDNACGIAIYAYLKNKDKR